MEKMIAYCGLLCTDCPAFIATQNDDQQALKQVAAQWTQEFNQPISPEDCICDGCLPLDGRLSSYCRYVCKVRSCALEKNVQNCAYCADYPCQELTSFLAFAPEAKATLDGIRQNF